MKRISFNLSGRLEPILVDVLRRINVATGALGIPFFIVGATARDILLEHCYGIKAGRATRDLDIGIKVAGWDEYGKLTSALLDSGSFTLTREPHRMCCGMLEIDMVPFGAVSINGREIRWPPDQAIVMSILGFQEAHDASLLVRLAVNPSLDVRVPTIPGLALLKLISWHESYPGRPKDAADLLLLMLSYAEAGNQDRLFEEAGLMETEDFNPTMAGIRLLGRDMASMAGPETSSVAASILQREVDAAEGHHRLVRDMTRGKAVFQRNLAEARRMLEKLGQGLSDRNDKWGSVQG
jgi:predicted nucleotidyltransferase